MLRKLSLLFIIVWLAGCSTLPESIQLAEQNQLVDYPQVASDPEQNKDKFARWGGVIAEVENQPDATVLELVFYPLRSYGRPIVSDESIGRFRVYVDGFLDPMVYAKGRAVTFTGQVLGTEEGLVGEQPYVFPALHSTGYHLWKEVQTVDISGVYVWPSSYWYGWYPRPFHQRVIIRNRSPNNANTSGSTRNSPSRINQPSDAALKRQVSQPDRHQR